MSSMGDVEGEEPIESSKTRTFEEIDIACKDAHVETEDLKPVYQALWFPEKKSLEDNLFLFELDKKLLSLLKEGQSLILRGEKDEIAVLCTENQTFNFQVAETSNSLALVPDIVWPGNANGNSEERHIESKQVEKICFEYFEVQPTYPRITKLMSILEPTSYKGPSYEETYKKNEVEFKSTRDLLKTVQASEAEILQALKENCVCHLDGYWRLLDQEYHHTVLSHLLKLVADESWPLNNIPKEEALKLLHENHPEEPVPVLEHVLDWYCEETDQCKFSLREDRVCRFLGEILLRLAAKFNLQEFLTAWQETVPKGMKTDLKYLDGIALKDDQTKPASIYFFPEWELPEDIEERFKHLFMAKPKWFIEEIKPYVQSLTTERMNVNALLTKYALASNLNGKRCYSARYGR